MSDQTIIEALRQLPQEIRWTILLSYVEELDEADAASILEVPVGTIKSRLHRGRQMLRRLLVVQPNHAR
jgi:RNA polymerase sigma-70 factor (ECF subfamily)